MSKPSPLADQPVTVRYGWLIALLAALCAVGLCLLVWHWPASPWTWAFATGLFVFAVVGMWLLTGWHRRMAATLFATGSASVFVPSLAFHFQWGDQARLDLVTENAPILTWACFAFAAFLVWIDHRQRYPWSKTIAPLVFLIVFAVGTITIWRDHRTKQPDESATNSPLSTVTALGPRSQAAMQQGTIIGNSPGNVAGDVHYHQGISQEFVDRLFDQLAEKDSRLVAQAEQIGKLLTENADKQLLRDALDRLNQQAIHGDTQASEALSEARESGDVSKLMTVLIRTADQMQADVESRLSELIEVCHEIAAIAYLQGDIDEARVRTDTILKFRPDDRDAVHRLGMIYKLQGDLDKAEQACQRFLELSADDPSWQAAAHLSLGNVYSIRGDLEQAEQMHRKSLKIEERLGHKVGMARQYGDLTAR